MNGFFLFTIDHTKPIDLTVRIASSNCENPFSYAIGTISIKNDLNWMDVERICTKLFVDHITQIDCPFDYTKASIGCSPSQIHTLTIGKNPLKTG